VFVHIIFHSIIICGFSYKWLNAFGSSRTRPVIGKQGINEYAKVMVSFSIWLLSANYIHVPRLIVNQLMSVRWATLALGNTGCLPGCTEFYPTQTVQ